MALNNFINLLLTKKTLAILAISLIICIFMSSSIISSLKKEIRSRENKISELNDKFNDLEKKVSDLELEKSSLEKQVSILGRIYNIRKESFNSSSQPLYIPTTPKRSETYFNGTEIDESESFSSQGSATVVFKVRGCDYMILENNSGFIVAEWMGGNDPDQGDNLGGKFNSYGTKEFYNISRRSKAKLWIDDYMLSKDRALEKINDKCD